MPYSDLLNSKLGDLSTTAGNAVADLSGVVAGADVLASQFADVKNALEDLQQFVNEFKGGYYYTPTGTIVPFGGVYPNEAPPAGWLACSGVTVTQAAYPDLFNVLTANGSAFPYGGSATTTYTPDLRGRTVIGVGAATTGATLTGVQGGVQGASTHTLSVAQMPVHSHTIDHDHAAASTGGSSADHTHSTGFRSKRVSTVSTGGVFALVGPTQAYDDTTSYGTGGRSVDHSHGLDLPNYTGSSGNAGGTGSPATTQAFNLAQPSMGLYYIIKT